MKSLYNFFLFTLFFIISSTLLNAQTFNGTWSCAYATIDNPDSNAVSYNAISVAVLGDNSFVALVNRESNNTNYLVGYVNADSTHGRLGHYAYGTSGIGGFQMLWINVFDQVTMTSAKALASFKDNTGVTDKVIVANNDSYHNLLMFQLGQDSVVSYPKRLETGSEPLWAIDVSKSTGDVFVTAGGDSTSAAKVLVFGSPDSDPAWTSSSHSGTPLQTITLPDPGTARGITVNSDGTVLYVSNYLAKKIYCYIGDVKNGYTLYNGFNFVMDSTFTPSNGITFSVGPWGLNFMDGKNILFVATAADFLKGAGYEYSRIFAVNPNTGTIMDTIDVAKWNFEKTGAYNNRPSNMGTASGYTSTYNIDFDENNNLYSQSYYGWTIEKWVYSSTLPTIKLTITDVKKEQNITPKEFSLKQNYPNPFNPTTVIEFSLPKSESISLSVFDITGQLVKNLINSSYFEKGVYKVSFNASKLASGTYIYRISNGVNQITKKMLLLK